MGFFMEKFCSSGTWNWDLISTLWHFMGCSKSWRASMSGLSAYLRQREPIEMILLLGWGGGGSIWFIVLSFVKCTFSSFFSITFPWYTFWSHCTLVIFIYFVSASEWVIVCEWWVMGVGSRSLLMLFRSSVKSRSGDSCRVDECTGGWLMPPKNDSTQVRAEKRNCFSLFGDERHKKGFRRNNIKKTNMRKIIQYFFYYIFLFHLSYFPFIYVKHFHSKYTYIHFPT